MKHYLFFLFALSLVLVSCDKDNLIQEPELEPSVYQYIYNEKYEMLDINLYVGPNGDKVEADQSYLKQYWGDVQDLINDTLIIDLEKDSLYLKDTSLTIKYGIINTNDSIFVKYNNDTFGFFGIFDKSKLLFNHYMSFYTRTRMPRPEEDIYGAYKFHRGTEYGIGTYSDHFYETFFESPEKMTKDGDNVFWSNFKFEYKQTVKKSK